MDEEKLKEKLYLFDHHLQIMASEILSLKDRVAALESERGIALAAYQKTHPEIVGELNKVLGVDSDNSDDKSPEG